MLSSSNALGGYLALELPAHATMPYPDAYRFQSARAAFLALLLAYQPRRVWMPAYICNSMFAPLKAAGIEAACYRITANFEIADAIALRASDVLLYVNYFGICRRQVDQVLQRFDPTRVILDLSQAFFETPRQCLANIYSPRKFFGLPDGGLLVTPLEIPLPDAVDEGSEFRTRHLIKRLAGGAEYGYSDYQAAEVSLTDCVPKQMSHLTWRLFNSIDFASVAAKRTENFYQLHRQLGGSNPLIIKDDAEAPLCYPFFTEDSRIRERLLSERIYVATYWPDVAARQDGQVGIEGTFARGIVALPCDQRCSVPDIERILDVMRSAGAYDPRPRQAIGSGYEREGGRERHSCLTGCSDLVL